MMMMKMNRLSIAEAVLGHPAGEELAGVLRAGDRPDTEAEDDGQGDEDGDEEAGLLHRRLVRARARTSTIDGQDDTSTTTVMTQA